jgi:hypothetical protein
MSQLLMELQQLEWRADGLEQLAHKLRAKAANIRKRVNTK